MRTGGLLTVQLIVLYLARNRACAADIIQEAWPTIVLLRFTQVTGTASRPSVFFESQQHVNFSEEVVFQTSS